MKKYFISVLIILNYILSHFCFAQVNDKPIRLSPEIKDTIELNERDYYNLYPDIEGYQYLVIYLNSDSTTVTKIIYRNDEGLVRDTVITNSADYVGNQKTYIRQINAERLENYETDDIITVTKLDGNQVVGKLLAVQDSSFILVPDKISDVGTLTFLKTYTKLNVKEVQSVFIDFDYWADVRTGAATGCIYGTISGFVIGFAQPIASHKQFFGSDFFGKFENALIGSAIGLALGASVGFATGLILATPDESIEINSASDLEKLKEYVVQ